MGRSVIYGLLAHGRKLLCPPATAGLGRQWNLFFAAAASAASAAASFFYFQSKHFVASVYKLRAESLALVCYLRRTQRKKEREKIVILSNTDLCSSRPLFFLLSFCF